jgi:hypothetical protein
MFKKYIIMIIAAVFISFLLAIFLKKDFTNSEVEILDGYDDIKPYHSMLDVSKKIKQEKASGKVYLFSDKKTKEKTIFIKYLTYSEYIKKRKKGETLYIEIYNSLKPIERTDGVVMGVIPIYFKIETNKDIKNVIIIEKKNRK